LIEVWAFGLAENKRGGRMKTLVSIIALCASLSAHAEVRTPIERVQELQYNGKTLTVLYALSGGCAEHKPEIQIELQKNTVTYTTTAVVTVIDVSDKDDSCEAILYPKLTVDLKAKVNELLDQQPEMKSFFLDVQLPKVDARR
jgi:hypothetical protein